MKRKGKNRHKLGIFVILFLPAFNLQAAPSLEDYGSLPIIQQVSVSPNGKKIAYRHTEDGKDYVFVLSLEKGERIASLDVQNVKPRKLYFANNDMVFFTSRRSYLRATVNFVKAYLH